jgi:hypothetical protein
MSDVRRCRYCETEFEPSVHNQRFCSYDCRRNWRLEVMHEKREQQVVGDECANCAHMRSMHFNERGACSAGVHSLKHGLHPCGCSRFKFKRKSSTGKTLVQLFEEGKL